MGIISEIDYIKSLDFPFNKKKSFSSISIRGNLVNLDLSQSTLSSSGNKVK
jgi:hypothetical protein